jgi:hypothetical protein
MFVVLEFRSLQEIAPFVGLFVLRAPFGVHSSFYIRINRLINYKPKVADGK